MKCAKVNAHRFWSKEASIRNMVVEEGVEVLVIVETQCSQAEFPKLPGFFTFYRNRENRKEVTEREREKRDLEMTSLSQFSFFDN